MVVINFGVKSLERMRFRSEKALKSRQMGIVMTRSRNLALVGGYMYMTDEKLERGSRGRSYVQSPESGMYVQIIQYHVNDFAFRQEMVKQCALLPFILT